MKAIVYVSNTGATKKYAELLGNEIKIPVFSLKDSKKKIKKESEIIYLGWIRAGKIMGYQKARKIYKIKALVGIGMSETGTQIKELKEKNKVTSDTVVMSLQGWFHLEDLHGIYHGMMKMMLKTAGNELEKKENRSTSEEAMLQVMKYGKNPVCLENLKELISWYDKEVKKNV